MEVGQFMKLEGYDQVAKAQTDYGFVGVYSNNHNFLFVVTVEEEAMSDGEGIHGRVEGEYPYHSDDEQDAAQPTDHDSWRDAYEKSLTQLIELTMRFTHE